MPQYITVKQVADMLSIGVSTIYRKISNGEDFPRGIKFGMRQTRWRLSDIEAWIALKSECGMQA